MFGLLTKQRVLYSVQNFRFGRYFIRFSVPNNIDMASLICHRKTDFFTVKPMIYLPK